MTVAELIAAVDEIRPNQISKQTKTLWLNEIEHRVYDETLMRAMDICPEFEYRPFEYDADYDAPLAVPDFYADLYRCYLMSKIDFSLGEIDRYNNDVAMFQAAWADYAAWYIRNHMPKERRYYGAVGLFTNEQEQRYASAVAVWGTEPTACGRIWGVFGPAKCISPVLPCHRCEKAERNNTDAPDQP